MAATSVVVNALICVSVNAATWVVLKDCKVPVDKPATCAPVSDDTWVVLNAATCAVFMALIPAFVKPCT